jgi:basic membrane lipoprotein Med (substrate-binding protein (PBP1-ABC) superfamily)
VVKRVRQVARARSAAAGRTGRFAAVGRTAVAWLRSLRGRTLAVAGGTLVVCAALMVAGELFFRDGDTRPPVPDTRARHYTEVDACLLTDGNGITAGTTAAQVWQGMQDASGRTHARVSYAQVTGKQTAGHALPLLNSMFQRSCDVVLATGRAEVAATAQAAPRQGKVAFVLVGGGHEGKNVTTLATGKGLRASVAAAVERAVDGRT